MKRKDRPLEETTTRDLWERVVSFDEGRCMLWHVGHVRIWVRRQVGEWFIAFEESGEYRSRPVVASPGEAPEGLSWNRYVAGRAGKIVLRPALPDRPVVIRPSSPVKILAGKGSQYYIHVPVWIAISDGSAKSQDLLVEHRGDSLSSTWFGSPDDGELCYSFTSDLYKSPEEREDHPLMALCPLSIRNGSSGTLDFQRVCVRVPHLHLYSGLRFLCTNEIELTYRGTDQSQITFRDSVPQVEAGLQHITPPRIPVNRNIIKKSFEYFKSLSLY